MDSVISFSTSGSIHVVTKDARLSLHNTVNVGGIELWKPDVVEMIVISRRIYLGLQSSWRISLMSWYAMFGGMESSGMLQHMSVGDFAVQARKGFLKTSMRISAVCCTCL